MVSLVGTPIGEDPGPRQLNSHQLHFLEFYHTLTNNPTFTMHSLHASLHVARTLLRL